MNIVERYFIGFVDKKRKTVD